MIKKNSCEKIHIDRIQLSKLMTHRKTLSEMTPLPGKTAYFILNNKIKIIKLILLYFVPFIKIPLKQTNFIYFKHNQYPS